MQRKVVRHSTRHSSKLYTDTGRKEKGLTKNFSPLRIENWFFALSKEAHARNSPRSYKACNFQAVSLGPCFSWKVRPWIRKVVFCHNFNIP